MFIVRDMVKESEPWETNMHCRRSILNIFQKPKKIKKASAVNKQYQIQTSMRENDQKPVSLGPRSKPKIARPISQKRGKNKYFSSKPTNRKLTKKAISRIKREKIKMRLKHLEHQLNTKAKYINENKVIRNKQYPINILKEYENMMIDKLDYFSDIENHQDSRQVILVFRLHKYRMISDIQKLLK